MKKITLFAAVAALAMSANAQYVTSEAGIEPVLKATNGKGIFDVFQLSPETVNAIKAAGNTVNDYALNNETRNLYIWDATFIAGDPIQPGVDFQFDGYVSLTVSSIGWSGAGYNAAGAGALDLSHINDNTRVHLAYITASNGPGSVGFILLNQDGKESPAKFAVGTAFNDNGVVYPTIGPAVSDEWQAVDVTLGDLKKICTGFDYEASKAWAGNYLAFLAGGVTGQNLGLDAFYFYTTTGAGINGVEAETELVVTNRTINAAGVNRIALYDLTGKTVKAVNNSVMGIENIPAGLYIVKAGNTVRKVVIK